MLRQADNKFHVAVGDGTILASALPAIGSVVTSSNLPENSITVCNVGLVRLSEANLVALGNNDQFIIVQGRGASQPLHKSEVLTKNKIKITKNKHVASQQQISVIGYEPSLASTFTLPSANDTSYHVKIRKNDNDAANRSQPASLFGQYKTGGSATVTETAFGLAVNLRKNMDLEPANGYMSIEVLSNGTIATISDGSEDQDAVVVSGSRNISLVDTGTTTAGDTAGIASAVTVGSFLNIAGATYQVSAVNANIVTLSTPYVGTSGTITGGTTLTTEFGSVTGVTLTGLRLTGVQADFDVNAFRDFYVNRFTPSFSDSSIKITLVQGAKEGTGVWQKVAMDEYMTYGFEGQNEMLAVPPRNRDTTVTEGAKYSAIEILWTENIDNLVTKAGAKGSVLIYCGLNSSDELPATTAAGFTADILGAIASPGFASTDLNE